MMSPFKVPLDEDEEGGTRKLRFNTLQSGFEDSEDMPGYWGEGPAEAVQARRHANVAGIQRKLKSISIHIRVTQKF